ncbi:MAG: hypothetical protein WC832_05335 [Anaerolineales bacterium]
MNKTFKKFIVALLIASLFVFPMAGVNGGVQAQDSFPPALEPYLSADGLTLYNGVAPLVVVVDPNPAMQGIKIPAPEVDKALADPDAASATFSFTYVAAGNQDPWGQVCTTFPEDAKTAFNAAAAIWTSTLQSSVLVTIQACWASLSGTTLGYSGGQPLRRNFDRAPKTNTWYEGALANALNGSDLDPTTFDMNITYNSNYTWYTGTDSNTPAGQYDLVTVAAHEIGHGLNFSGSASYSGGTGSYGYDTGYPNVYDTFMEDGSGMKLILYPNPSADLGTLLTSGSLWFNGSNANAANLCTRVKMYAPPSWNGGSSYGHLDEIFNGTVNDMMTYSVAAGSANHNPGPVTTGLLKDLGWVLAGESTGSCIYLPMVLRDLAGSLPGNFNKSAPANGATSQPANPTLSWGASSNATSYEYCINTSNDNACTTWTSTAASTSVGLSGLTPTTPYYWQVRANNASGSTNADGGTWWSFTTAASSPGGGIVNGDFESGSTGWTEYSAKGYTIIYSTSSPYLEITPHSGSYVAWLGGANDETAYIQQQITIPSSAPYLVYWHWIASADVCGFDLGEVLINGTLVDYYDLCDAKSTGGWVSHSVNLSAYGGQSVKLQIGVETDGSDISNLYVDDVSLQASASALGPIQGVAPNLDASTTQGKIGIVAQGEKPQGTGEKRLLNPR